MDFSKKIRRFSKSFLIFFIFSFLMPFQSHGESITSSGKSSSSKYISGLVGHWKFDDYISGSTSKDSSGEKNTARASSTNPPLSSDQVPKFFNSKTRSIDVSEERSFLVVKNPGTEDFTICAWINFSDQTGSAPNFFIASTGTSVSSITLLSGGYAFGISNTNKLFYRDSTSSVTSSSEISANKWSHVCVSKKRSSGEILLYSNGDLIGERERGKKIPILSKKRNVIIGNGSNSRARTTAFIDDLKIYSRKLTVSEIRNMHEQDRLKIISWKAENFKKSSSKCPVKLKITIKGNGINRDAQVKIGSEKASKIERHSSKEIDAFFCLKDLEKRRVGLKRAVIITNPGFDTKEADKKIDLQAYFLIGKSSGSYSTVEKQGIKNLQKVFISLDLLKKQDLTGKFDPRTKEALNKFQKEEGIPPAEVIGPKTLKALQAIGNE